MTFLVYKTDVHHSYASRDIIGVADHKIHAIQICQSYAKKDEDISETQIYNLATIKQTQGYDGEGEFQFEAVQMNELI